MYRAMKSQTLERKINSALNGDPEALEDLVEVVNTQSRITNQRMSALKKQDLDFSSYDRAQRAAQELGSDKFHKWTVEDAELNMENLIFQARETRLFLARPQSTISGAKELLNDYLSQLEQNRWIKSRNNYSVQTQHDLARLMSEGLKDLISVYYENAEEQVEIIGAGLEHGTLQYGQARSLVNEILYGIREYEDLFDVLISGRV